MKPVRQVVSATTHRSVGIVHASGNHSKGIFDVLELDSLAAAPASKGIRFLVVVTDEPVPEPQQRAGRLFLRSTHGEFPVNSLSRACCVVCDAGTCGVTREAATISGIPELDWHYLLGHPLSLRLPLSSRLRLCSTRRRPVHAWRKHEKPSACAEGRHARALAHRAATQLARNFPRTGGVRVIARTRLRLPRLAVSSGS